MGPAPLSPALTGEYCCANVHLQSKGGTQSSEVFSLWGLRPSCQRSLVNTVALTCTFRTEGNPRSSEVFSPWGLRPSCQRSLVNTAVQLLVSTAALAVRTAEQGTPSNLLAIAGEYCCAGRYYGAGSALTYFRRSLLGLRPYSPVQSPASILFAACAPLAN